VSNSVNQGDTFLPLLSNFTLEYAHMKFKTTRRGWILMINTIMRNSYSYTVCYWGGCSVGGREEMTCIVKFCMTVYSLSLSLYIYIYIYIYMRYFLPSDLLPCEGIKIYSKWQTVNAKLNKYVVWWGKKHWQSDYRLGFWQWY